MAINFSKVYNGINGVYKIIEQVDDSTVRVKFNRPNIFGEFTEINANIDEAVNSKVKDPYRAEILGVACKGIVPKEYTEKQCREYILWNSIITRVHKRAAGKYTIDPRWLCYENFLHDITSMQGYDVWKGTGDYSFVRDPSTNEYNATNCFFVEKDIAGSITNAISPNKNNGITYRGIRKVNDTCYTVEVSKTYYGRYNTIEAAANMYNLIIRGRGLPECLMNDVPKMSIHDINEHRIQAKEINGRKLMYRLIDPRSGSIDYNRTSTVEGNSVACSTIISSIYNALNNPSPQV